MLRRHRNTRPTRESVAPEGQQSERPTAERPCTGDRQPGAGPAAASDDATATRREQVADQRREPAPEDQAVYSCACGYVFQAAVSTSVGCPHCGGSQAW
jgi:hypothetical protein